MSHTFGKLGLYIMPVFKNGKVMRLSIPRWIGRALSLSPGDYVIWRQNDRGEITIAKFDTEKLRDEYVQGRAAQLTLGTRDAATRGDGSGKP